MLKSFCLTVVLLIAFYLSTNAQSGYLDLGFNEDGIYSADFGTNGFDILYDAVLQEDGKILATGISNNDFAVLRLLPDGTPDPEFGDDGVAQHDFNGTSDRSHAIVIQPDGRIVVAGQIQINSQADFAVLRLLSDGKIDSTFGTNGWTVTDLGTDYEFPNCAALQADGKIIAAGRKADVFQSDFTMVRYHTDGRVDSLFGNNGIVGTNLREEDEVTSIAIQPDGQILLAGFASISAKGDFAVARYNPDGTLDKFFGEGGHIITDIEGVNASDLINAMVLLPDGKILAAGFANYFNLDGTSDIGIVRYDENGILDPEFGVGGVSVTRLGSSTNTYGMSVQPDGKIIVGGVSNVIMEEKRWLLARFHSNGVLDEGFGTTGYTTTEMPGNNGSVTALLIQPDSRIILAGYTGANPDLDYTVARYIADFILTQTVTAITCPGANDGSITIEASGGVAPYGYSIDGVTFQSENIFTNLPPGTYTITIRDSNGPGTTGSIGPIVIHEAIIPTVDVTVVENNITITVGNEGVPPYNYTIDSGHTFSTSGSFPDLNDGTYHILVWDGNDCLIHNSFVVLNLTATHAPMTSLAFNISPNPASGQVRLEMNNTAGEPLQMRIMDMTGRIVYTAAITETGPVIRKFDLKFLDNGVYQVWVGNEKIWGTKKLAIAR